jgi:hypothetical protein
MAFLPESLSPYFKKQVILFVSFKSVNNSMQSNGLPNPAYSKSLNPSLLSKIFPKPFKVSKCNSI